MNSVSSLPDRVVFSERTPLGRGMMWLVLDMMRFSPGRFEGHLSWCCLDHYRLPINEACKATFSIYVTTSLEVAAIFQSTNVNFLKKSIIAKGVKEQSSFYLACTI